jgi:hypothetical protein
MRLRLAVLLAAVATLAAAADGRACSQCTCGVPFPSDVLGGVGMSQLRFGIEERYLSKSNALDEEVGEEEAQEHRISAFGLWRASHRLTLLGRLPYNVKKLTERPEGAEEVTENSSGLGDAEVLALVGLMHLEGSRPLALGLVVGVTAPTGDNDAKGDDGDRLEAHLQPGTGAWSGTVGFNVAVTAGAGLVDLSLLGRANGESDPGYRYGDALLYNVGFTSSPHNGWQLVAQLNGRSAERDRSEDGTTGKNTGGTVVYATPGVRWTGDLGLTLEAEAQIPVVQSLFGDQTEHATARLGLSLSR